MFNLAKKDVNAIEQLHRRWIAAEQSGNGLDVLELCTDDVRWMVPNSEVIVGKDAAKPMLADTSIKILAIETQDIDIRGSGFVAYKTSKYTTRFFMEGTQEEQVAQGTHLWILHKMKNEEWKVALVTWQSSSQD
jgi:ketosteroid isomerase-like protein